MNSFFGTGRLNITPVVLNLIIINFIIWIAELIPGFGNSVENFLGLHYIASDAFRVWQPLTYMFVHDNGTLLHILFNMFTLWMFGPLLERVWGSGRFLFFYLICGIGAAIMQEGVWSLTWQHDYIAAIAPQNGLTYDSMKAIVDDAMAHGDADFISAMTDMKNHLLTVGASGAIFGLLLGFAFVFPDMPLYLFFIPVPIKAKYMVIGYAVLEFFLGVNGSLSSIAHFAHLGGMLFGLIPLLVWKHKGTLRGNRFY